MMAATVLTLTCTALGRNQTGTMFSQLIAMLCLLCFYKTYIHAYRIPTYIVAVHIGNRVRGERKGTWGEVRLDLPRRTLDRELGVHSTHLKILS